MSRQLISLTTPTHEQWTKSLGAFLPSEEDEEDGPEMKAFIVRIIIWHLDSMLGCGTGQETSIVLWIYTFSLKLNRKRIFQLKIFTRILELELHGTNK